MAAQLLGYHREAIQLDVQCPGSWCDSAREGCEVDVMLDMPGVNTCSSAEAQVQELADNDTCPTATTVY